MDANDNNVLLVVVKGDRATAERAAAERGIPFRFDSAMEGQTIGTVPSGFWGRVAVWFGEDGTTAPFPAGACLFFSEKRNVD